MARKISSRSKVQEWLRNVRTLKFTKEGHDKHNDHMSKPGFWQG